MKTQWAFTFWFWGTRRCWSRGRGLIRLAGGGCAVRLIRRWIIYRWTRRGLEGLSSICCTPQKQAGQAQLGKKKLKKNQRMRPTLLIQVCLCPPRPPRAPRLTRGDRWSRKWHHPPLGAGQRWIFLLSWLWFALSNTISPTVNERYCVFCAPARPPVSGL